MTQPEWSPKEEHIRLLFSLTGGRISPIVISNVEDQLGKKKA